MNSPSDLFAAIRDETASVLIGNEDVIEHLSVALLTGNHVILEGVPGVAKTTIANLFAKSSGLNYRRIQMTPDLLPADITGTKVYRESTEEFELQRGPIFANLVLADEINRATPKTQSALLEAMQERQVTIEGDTLQLPSPFMVLATQNPIEMEGTFGLPEAQRDRFQFKIQVDIPDSDSELELLNRFDSTPGLGPEDIDQVVDVADILAARDVVTEVFVDESVKSYILDLIQASRESSDVSYGGSPRASLALLHASKARAAIRGREYVIPDDPKALAEPTLAHRLVLNTDAELSDISPRDVVRDLVNRVSPPNGDEVASSAEAVNDGGQRVD